MQITKTLDVTDRAAWRQWLAAHYKTEPDVWLVYHRKSSGRPRIPYNDAVEEALCFGWIDSTVKRLDEDRFAQRFSPRRPGSSFSQPNIERLRRMVAQGRVAPDVRAALGDVLDRPFVFPPDILAALQANERAWAHFQQFSEPYRRIRVAFVEAARDRPDVFARRLAHLVRMTEKGRRFGHGIETYY